MRLSLAGQLLLLLYLPLPSLGQDAPYARTLKGVKITSPSGSEPVSINANYQISWDYDASSKVDGSGLVDLDLVIANANGTFLVSYYLGTAKLEDKEHALDPEAGWGEADLRVGSEAIWQVSLSTLTPGSGVYSKAFKLVEGPAKVDRPLKPSSTSSSTSVATTKSSDVVSAVSTSEEAQQTEATETQSTEASNRSPSESAESATNGGTVGLSKAGEIGIGVGIALVAVVLLAILLLLLRRRRQNEGYDDDISKHGASSPRPGTSIFAFLRRKRRQEEYDEIGKGLTPTYGPTSYDFYKPDQRSWDSSTEATLRNETIMARTRAILQAEAKLGMEKPPEWYELSARGTIYEMPERNSVVTIAPEDGRDERAEQARRKGFF